MYLQFELLLQYEAEENKPFNIIFAGTAPGEFTDVMKVKITFKRKAAGTLNLYELILEICHHPGKLT